MSELIHAAAPSNDFAQAELSGSINRLLLAGSWR